MRGGDHGEPGTQILSGKARGRVSTGPGLPGLGSGGPGWALGSGAWQIREGASCRMRAAWRVRGLRTRRRREGLLQRRGGGFLERRDPSGSGLQRDKRGVPRGGRPQGSGWAKE